MSVERWWAESARRNDLLVLRALDESDWYETKLLPRYAPADARGCELWTRGTDTGGYGMISLPKAFWPSQDNYSGRAVKAHRVRWLERHRSPVPYGLELDHVVCSTRMCGTPEHLTPSTPEMNSRRGNTGSLTHCKRGLHVLNTHDSVCQDCRRARTSMQNAWIKAARTHLGMTQHGYLSTHGASLEVAVRVLGANALAEFIASQLDAVELSINASNGRSGKPNLQAEIAMKASRLAG